MRGPSGYFSEEERDARGVRGGYLHEARLQLKPGDTHRWSIIADVDQDAAQIEALRKEIESDSISSALEEEIQKSSTNLVQKVAASDGLSITSDRTRDSRHYSNTLYNIMRGGIPVEGYFINLLGFCEYLSIRNRQILESLDKALKYMDSIGGGKRKSIYGYTSKGNPKPAMVSEGMFCHQLLRQHAIDQHSASPQDINLRLEESSKYIEKNLPTPRRLKYNYYYWYYACLALHQQQGPIWESWNARMRPVFLKAQVKRPGQAALHGSWDPIGEWGPQAGRCIITGMATLSLEVYYRYLPMYNPNQD